MPVEFELLGEVRARAAGRWIDLGHARQRCVLAALLVEPNLPRTLDVLAERVWGDRPPKQARGTLYGYLYRLRQAFAEVSEVRIDRNLGGYVVPVSENAVDLHRFRRLVKRSHDEDDQEALVLAEQALGLWHGPALGALEGQWVEAVRRGLEQERWQAMLYRNDIALRLGHHDSLMAELSTLAEENPLDERLAGQLMLALYRSGRQADALRLYQVVRSRLVDELGADPGPQLSALHQKVLAGEQTFATTRRTTPIPRQLPAMPRLFVGRVDQLARMDKALTSARGESPVLTVVGAPGTGKTTLALHWAHRAIDRFPDGQLHADLRGFDPTDSPVPPATVVCRFLEALGVPAVSVPADPGSQAGLYRSLVAGKRLLVVLDNARDTSQILPLLPGSSTCAVLITSRHRVTGLAVTHGVPTLELDVLTDAEARDLLGRYLSEERLTDEPNAIADLIRWCAGLPLAVGIMAARAAAYPDFPLRLLVDELRATDGLASSDAAEPTADLRAVFTASYRLLPHAARRTFALLATAPGPDIGLPAAAALLDLPTRRVRELLHHLEASHLVRQHTPSRYRMHDLIRIYATERARNDHADELESANLRVIDFYTRTGRSAERVLYRYEDPAALGEPAPRDPDITDEATALAWMSTEYLNVVTALHTAVQLDSHHHVWQLAWALDTFQRRRGLLHEQLAVWRAATAAADLAAQPGPRALSSWRLGAALARTGELTEAARHLDLALALGQESDDASSQANAHQALAWVSEQQGDNTTALQQAGSALAILRTLGEPMREAHGLNQVGWYAAKIGDLAQAQHCCEAALKIIQRHADSDAEARTLDSLGYIAHLAGHHQVAIQHFERALLRFDEAGASYDYADTLERLGDTHAVTGHHEQAQKAWRQALSMYRDQHRPADAHRLTIGLGDSDTR